MFFIGQEVFAAMRLAMAVGQIKEQPKKFK